VSDFSIHIDLGKAREATGNLRAAIVRNVESKLWRGAEEVARLAKGNAPKAFSNLTNSIRAERVGEMHYLVSEGMNYGRAVEEGGRPHHVNSAKLIPWVERVLGARGKDARNKAFLIARAIAVRGTRAQKYMQPAADSKRDRVRELVMLGVNDGIREAMA
jgi:hypothetical protein